MVPMLTLPPPPALQETWEVEEEEEGGSGQVSGRGLLVSVVGRDIVLDLWGIGFSK